MTISREVDEKVRALQRALADKEAALRTFQREIIRRDAEEAITRSGASAPAALAFNMGAAGRIAGNGRDIEYFHGGRWLNSDAYVTALKHDPETARFFVGAVPRKPSPSLQPNPFARATWNLTEQMRLIRTDPDRAAMLRREST